MLVTPSALSESEVSSNILSPSGEVTRDNATYNWSWVKTVLGRYKSTCLKLCPWLYWLSSNSIAAVDTGLCKMWKDAWCQEGKAVTVISFRGYIQTRDWDIGNAESVRWLFFVLDHSFFEGKLDPVLVVLKIKVLWEHWRKAGGQNWLRHSIVPCKRLS